MTGLLLLLLFLAQASAKIDFYSSTCDEDTKWNTKNVSQALKDWILSIRIVHEWPTEISIRYHGMDETDKLEFVGNMDKDKNASGPYWLSGGYNSYDSFNNGFLYGPLDEHNQMTGKNIAFIYPDMKTALLGEFNNSVMIGARETKVIAERCHKHIKEVKFKTIDTSKPLVRYEPLGEFRFSGDPLVGDPYERRTVYLMETPMGDGLFAKRDIKEYEHIAYYSGTLQNITERPFYHDNMTEDDLNAVHKNLISFDSSGVMEMDVLPEYWSVYKYRATLAHKTNHAFLDGKVNSKFSFVFHPRYKTIRGIQATKDISRGEQIYVNYGYDLSDVNPQWFYDAYREEVDELPLAYRNSYVKRFGEPKPMWEVRGISRREYERQENEKRVEEERMKKWREMIQNRKLSRMNEANLRDDDEEEEEGLEEDFEQDDQCFE